MTVALEAVAAKHGDALLLHLGTSAEPILWVIDGGPSGVYASYLRPRLEELRAARGLNADEPLPIDLVIVSHVDDDHVRGVLDLVTDITDAQDHQQPAPWDIKLFWHNSFDTLLEDPQAHAVRASITDGLEAVRMESTFDARALSIDQGRRLGDQIRLLGLDGNPPIGGLLLAPRQETVSVAGATVTVVGPPLTRLKKLADEWEAKVKEPIDRSDLAGAAAYVDRSVTNLSSIALHVEADGRTLLLTGDARGDDLIAGLGGADLLEPDGRCHVDVLKVAHHGSDRDHELSFFDQVVADSYVISADGKYDNPSADVLRWIVSTQADRDYEIVLTYGDANGAADFLDNLRTARHNFRVRTRPDADSSITVALDT